MIQLTLSWASLLPAPEAGGVWVVKGVQAGEASRAGRWAEVGQSAMMTTGAAGAASSTCRHTPVSQQCRTALTSVCHASLAGFFMSLLKLSCLVMHVSSTAQMHADKGMPCQLSPDRQSSLNARY